jgi:hypothetical protein
MKVLNRIFILIQSKNYVFRGDYCFKLGTFDRSYLRALFVFSAIGISSRIQLLKLLGMKSENIEEVTIEFEFSGTQFYKEAVSEFSN